MMKMIKYTLFTIAAMVAVSCAKENAPENNDNAQVNPNLVEISLTATGEGDESDAETKAVFSGYPKIAWEGNEEISLLGTNTGNQKLVANGKGHQTTFTGYADVTDEAYFAVYPYDANVSVTSDGKISNVTVPAVQTATAGSFDPKAYIAVAKSTDKESLYFKAVGAFVKFKVEDAENVKSVTMVSNAGANMACSATVAFNNDGGVSHGSPYVDGTASSSVKMVGDFQSDKAYFMVVRPQPYAGGVTFYIEYKDGTILSRKGESALFESGKARNYIRNLNTLQKKDFKPVTDLYTLYNMGYDVNIGDKVINKATCGEATLVTESMSLNNTGIYFINSGVENVSMPAKTYDKDTYIIGNGTNRADVKLSGTIQWKANTLAFKNINLVDDYTGDLLKPNAANGSILFENCALTTDSEKSQLIYSNTTIINMAFLNCDIKVAADTKEIIKMGVSGVVTNLHLYNNIFFSSEENGAYSFKVVSNGSSVENLTLNQNTFANVYPISSTGSATHYMTPTTVVYYEAKNNLFYLPLYDTLTKSMSTVLTAKPTSNDTGNNLLYKTLNNDRLRLYSTDESVYPARTSVESNAIKTVDLANGIIVPATTAGATR